METGQDPSRDAHHLKGHNAINQLEEQGIKAAEHALKDLIDLIVLVEEGETAKEVPDKNLPSFPPTSSLLIYLREHSERISEINQSLTSLGARISEKVSQLKSLLY